MLVEDVGINVGDSGEGLQDCVSPRGGAGRGGIVCRDDDRDATGDGIKEVHGCAVCCALDKVGCTATTGGDATTDVDGAQNGAIGKER